MFVSSAIRLLIRTSSFKEYPQTRPCKISFDKLFAQSVLRLKERLFARTSHLSNLIAVNLSQSLFKCRLERERKRATGQVLRNFCSWFSDCFFLMSRVVPEGPIFLDPTNEEDMFTMYREWGSRSKCLVSWIVLSFATTFFYFKQMI